LNRRPPGVCKHSHGTVLLAALVMLIALMLGAAALMRMVESANLLSGNLAFKRAATLAAEAGTEAAIAWLAQQDAATLAQDQAGQGYYASDAANFDATGNRGGSQSSGVDWQSDDCAGAAIARCLKPVALAEPGTDAAGNTVRYVVQRLCAVPGAFASSGGCAFHYPAEADSSSRSGLSYGRSQRLAGAPLAYYRITARASGPRNTVSVIEVLVRY
jgi:type IV pilus assembly protein PilX